MRRAAKRKTLYVMQTRPDKLTDVDMHGLACRDGSKSALFRPSVGRFPRPPLAPARSRSALSAPLMRGDARPIEHHDARHQAVPRQRSEGRGEDSMSRVLLLATILGLSSATPVAAADTVRIIGAGTASCGDWMAKRTASSVDALQHQQWVLGYLSSVANWTDPDPMKGLDAEAVWAWMDSYCRAHPLATVSKAARAFVEGHPCN